MAASRVIVAIVCFGAACAAHAPPASAADPIWLTGVRLQSHLAQKVGISWTATPLRTALRKLGDSQNVAVLLDRRIDPDQKPELMIESDPLETVFKRIAERTKTGYSQFGSVAYFGPVATAAKLRTLAALRKDEAGKLAKGLRVPLLRFQPLRWDELATPKELLEGLSKESGVTIQNLDRVPHDLWAAADLPALSWIERVTLIAVQFDLTFSIDPSGKAIDLIDIPETVSLERTYTITGPADNVKKLSAALPNSQLQVTGGKLHVRGPAEDVDLIETALTGKAVGRTTVTAGKQVFTLQVTNSPVGRLLNELAKQMELEIKFDEPAIQAAGLSLTTNVSLDVKGVSADELLQAAVGPAGLSFTRKDKTIEVGPKK